MLLLLRVKLEVFQNTLYRQIDKLKWEIWKQSVLMVKQYIHSFSSTTNNNNNNINKIKIKKWNNVWLNWTEPNQTKRCTFSLSICNILVYSKSSLEIKLRKTIFGTLKIDFNDGNAFHSYLYIDIQTRRRKTKKEDSICHPMYIYSILYVLNGKRPKVIMCERIFIYYYFILLLLLLLLLYNYWAMEMTFR